MGVGELIDLRSNSVNHRIIDNEYGACSARSDAAKTRNQNTILNIGLFHVIRQPLPSLIFCHRRQHSIYLLDLLEVAPRGIVARERPGRLREMITEPRNANRR
jgi:hypothetical protein